MKLSEAEEIVNNFVSKIKDKCERIFVAGSIARKKAEIKDADIVLIPKTHDVLDMFKQPVDSWSELDERLGELYLTGEFQYHQDGPKKKSLILTHYPLNIELWIVSAPAQWGVIQAIRTGPSDFSHQFVTQRNKQAGPLSNGTFLPGLLPSWAQVKDGAVWANGHIVEMPEEIDLFNYLELEWIPPEERQARLPKYFKRL